MRAAWSFLAVLATGCFVSEGDCVQNGVSVTPCTVQLRPGQTAVLRARIPGAPAEPVDWVVPQSALSAFTLQANGNELVLVSKLNVPGSFPVQASSQTEPTFFGGGVVGVSSATFGTQPPPFFFFGGGLPVGTKAGATAIGGNLYFVAYADALAPLQEQLALGPGESTNRFLKRYTLDANQLTADVPDQFELFTGIPSPIVPNVAADCLGTAYWIDLESLPDGYVLRRLRANSNVVETRAFEGAAGPQFSFIAVRSIAVSCEGQIYFVGQDSTSRLLWRLSSFLAEPVSIDVPELDDYAFIYESYAVDEVGRMVIGAASPDGPALVRLLIHEEIFVPSSGPSELVLVGTIDPKFELTDDLGGVGSLTLDRHGAVYATRDPLSGGGPYGIVSVLNTRGETVYVLDRYEYQCPSGCSASTCGTEIAFNDIQWIGAGPEGQLRVIDRIAQSPVPDPACDESVRLILLDPE